MTNPFSRIVGELRDRKLLPIVALLLVAIVAVPVALSKTAATPAPGPATPVASTVPGAASLPAVAVRAAVTPVKLDSRPHNPFDQGHAAKAKSKGSSTAKQTSSASSSSATTSQPVTAGGSSSSGGTGSTTTTTSTSTTATTHAVGPATLADDQAYTMTIGITDGNGLNTLPGVERLRPLPSASDPLLLPLGVLEGGSRSLFAVLPGTVVSGPGRCVPGVIDCEVLVLSPNQVERVSLGSSYVAEFAVTAIHAARYSSVAAAQAARRTVSAQGDSLLHQADLSAVALFPFDPSRGALIDQRNLDSGGN